AVTRCDGKRDACWLRKRTFRTHVQASSNPRFKGQANALYLSSLSVLAHARSTGAFLETTLKIRRKTLASLGRQWTSNDQINSDRSIV
ncbi:hypothetical protein R3X27_14185, partial [Tropicimonas sp. TH_r6]|uniref:hypothetical protein n=1 Tax=Tropicimonas sp. TH_r6 TaxID=3082085 RepID=UPI00295453C0